MLVWSSASRLRIAHAAEDPVTKQQTERKVYADGVRQTYLYIAAGASEAVYGKGKLALPGNAAIEGGDFIPSTAFPTAEYCGHCHQEAYAQWRQALHSNSFRTPFYRTSVNLLIHEKGIAFARHCDSCHNPIAVVSGSLDAHATADRSFDRDGLTCMTCHSIQQVDSKLGNGSYVLGVPAVMVDADGKRIPGMVPDAEILAHLDRHSQAVMQKIYQSPEFCSACHKANLPVMLNDYKWIRAFSAYDEWQGSKYSKQNPLVFYTADYTTCQGCHMKREAIMLREPGAKRGMFTSHRWLAGNTAVPFYMGFDEQLKRTTEFLQSGNFLNVDIFGMKTSGTDALQAPLGSVPFKVDPAKTLETYVVIQSKAIGHSLIPEVRDLYEAWVSFKVTDAKGKTVYESGYLRPDGTLEPGAHSFTNRPVNSAGDFVDNHRVWTIHSVAYDNSIPAGRSTLVRYRFRVPDGVQWPITVRAAVEYRHLRQSYLNNVLGEGHPAYPVVEVTSRSRVINAGDNSVTPALATDNPDWMRWNNLGISYLDQLQYAEAMDAFEHVTRLRPDYKDGFINLGLNDIEWEKYADARAPLEKALALAPHDARALYYLALVERRGHHPEQAIADLEEVLSQYPRARDALRELGISYYQQHRAEEAVATFKRLQNVDPDDLAAHYNLAVLYRRLGMKAEAQKESAQYAMKWIDPGAPTYSLEYLRKHPEISNESVPWHVHADDAHEMSTAKAGAQ
ncbi:Tetratricopeptide repeat-containing protein [Bryocella elongata]|uniref:Tetratricopeptide repeat-containing protein n=1 Tax=Bryocella elongata TaxID=863522 RepID=A0A1H5Z5M9_9BACT|nr:tetratricopeptide repeat protein [Bryocella elongata]SEG31320.1 Tetratricopeptide repeat-containing protein [Bryocella elongata]